MSLSVQHRAIISRLLKIRPRYKMPMPATKRAPSPETNMATYSDPNFIKGVDPHSGRAVFSRRAAVLLPLCLDQNIPSVLLIRRSNSLRHHSGQIAFPGGIFDDEDNLDPVKCALREANEEIGLEADSAEILGLHHDCTTQDRAKNTPGTVITPVVAFIKQDISTMKFTLSEGELDMLFAVPLHRLAQLSEWSPYKDRPSFPFTVGGAHVIDRQTAPVTLPEEQAMPSLVDLLSSETPSSLSATSTSALSSSSASTSPASGILSTDQTLPKQPSVTTARTVLDRAVQRACGIYSARNHLPTVQRILSNSASSGPASSTTPLIKNSTPPLTPISTTPPEESVRIWGATAWVLNIFLKQVYIPSVVELLKQSEQSNPQTKKSDQNSLPKS